MDGQSFDVAILGGGPGGYPAAIRAAQYGLRVAVIEKYKVGGTCLHWGCIPTKVILESAEVYSMARRGQEFGVNTGSVTLDYSQVSKRREKVVATSTGGVEFLFKKHGVTLIRGEGKLTSPTTIAVTLADGGTSQVSAKDVIIATGSTPKGLPGVKIDGERIINSDHASTMAELPGSVIIIGAGAIGAEFASAWNDMGTQVTLVEMLPRVLPLEDAEISQELAKLFSRRGIKVMVGTGVKLDSIQTFPDRVELDVEQNGSVQRLSAERLLIATGRAPATTGIGLEALGVKIERGFIQVDGLMRTGVPHLYAIGDAVGGLMLAHKATAEGLLAAAVIAGKEAQPLDYKRIPSCTYCRPQVASVGWREAEARESGRNIKVGKFPFMASGMARVIGERDGFVKIIVDEESMEILGVHIFGPRATELIAEPALARLLEATPEEIALNVHPHPTLSEALMEAAEAVEGKAIHFA
ncbi:MAG: dihydrolipoyl dehydrogenase [Chloroflexota bacterium]|jgi:dihydrolipoamide dehydrogenase